MATNESELLFAVFGAFTSAIIWGFILIRYSAILFPVKVVVSKSPVSNLIVFHKSGVDVQRRTRADVLKEAKQLANKYGLRYCILHYDLPMQLQKEHVSTSLQWCVGCILAEGRELLDMQLVKQFYARGYRVAQLPIASSVVRVTITRHALSRISLDDRKVYPQLAKYIRQHRLCAHPYMEIHDANVSYYMAPLARQSGFYIPEPKNTSAYSSSDEGQTYESSVMFPKLKQCGSRHRKQRSACPSGRRSAIVKNTGRNASAPCRAVGDNAPIPKQYSTRVPKEIPLDLQAGDNQPKCKKAEKGMEIVTAHGDQGKQNVELIESDSDCNMEIDYKNDVHHNGTIAAQVCANVSESSDECSVSVTVSNSLLMFSSESGSDGDSATYPGR